MYSVRQYKILAVFLIAMLLTSVQLIYADDQVPLGQSDETPAGQAEAGVEADVFGEEGGRFHPFLLFEAQYHDNIFYVEANEDSDLIFTVAPGIWLAFPGNKEKLLDIGTSPSSVGGMPVSRIKPDSNRRYQTYLLYSPQFVFYSDFSEQDHTNQRLEGLFQYNFSSGLSIDLVDQFNMKEEVVETGTDDDLYEYTDNIFSFLATYDPSEKFRFRFDYSNYMLDYDEVFNSYRDRTDNSFSFYVFYKFRPKTSFFAEYEFADIDFDDIGGPDSQENRYYGGIAWEMTAKTKGQFKLGLTDKDFDDPALEDDDLFSMELQFQHSFSGSSGLTLTGYRKFNESAQTVASHYSLTGISAAYLHRFNSKWSASVSASYDMEKYEGFDRDDNILTISPNIRFKPKKWLVFDLGYQYNDRDSDYDVYEYVANIFYFRMNLSM